MIPLERTSFELASKLNAVSLMRASDGSWERVNVSEIEPINKSATRPVQVSSDPWVIRLKGTPEVRDAALDELRGLLVRGLTKLMASRYGGGYSAEDVVQDALVKILDSLDQFAGRSRFTTWAMTVATRIGISEMRRKHYQDVSIDAFASDGASFEVADEDDVTMSAEFDRQLMVAKLQMMIEQTLSEKQRFAIRASLAGLPVEAIAEKSGSNRNSVYKLVHDARLKLRTGLESAGISADELAAAYA